MSWQVEVPFHGRIGGAGRARADCKDACFPCFAWPGSMISGEDLQMVDDIGIALIAM